MRASNGKVFCGVSTQKAIKKGFLKANKPETLVICGGDDRDRTGDLYVANVPLSQLSYIPTLLNLINLYHHTLFFNNYFKYFPVEILSVDDALVKEAAEELKTQYPLAYADASVLPLPCALRVVFLRVIRNSRQWKAWSR